MIKGIKYSAVSAAILLAMSSITHAEVAEAAKVAKIIGLSGSAIVERGGYRYVAQEGMLLNEGDIVRSLEGSKVNLKYDSCQASVAATMQVNISAKKSMCHANSSCE